MSRWLLFLLYIYGHLALADETVMVCYGYGCLVETEVTIVESRWQQLGKDLNAAVDALDERKILSGVMGRLYAWAGEQSPIHNDRGGNYADAGVSGAMDCIDHSRTTTRFLNVLERRGLLRWHRVLMPVLRRRGYIFEHYAAAIEEKSELLGVVAGIFVVDSWFVDNGKPAVILPLHEWKKGAGPDV